MILEGHSQGASGGHRPEVLGRTASDFRRRPFLKGCGSHIGEFHRPLCS